MAVPRMMDFMVKVTKYEGKTAGEKNEKVEF